MNDEITFCVLGGKYDPDCGVNWKYISEPHHTLEAALNDFATCGFPSFPITQLEIWRGGKRIHCLQEAKS